MPFEVMLGMPADNTLMLAINTVLALITKLMPSLLGYQILFTAHSHFGSSDQEIPI